MTLATHAIVCSRAPWDRAAFFRDTHAEVAVTVPTGPDGLRGDTTL
jgi:hypothetical protein